VSRLAIYLDRCFIDPSAVGFLNPSSNATLVTAGTTLLSLSFVFAVSTQEVLGSCIFLFVKHPFDVLDRVDIGADQLIVEHISLLYTVFKKVDTQKLTQVPNIVLNSLWIQNVSRSKAMKEQLLMFINFDTTLEDIQLLKNEMQAFVLDKENCRDFQPDIDVEVTGIHEMNKLELRVEIKHKVRF
jgi:small-conductance mechanosensitive channel